MMGETKKKKRPGCGRLNTRPVAPEDLRIVGLSKGIVQIT
jgi:hypothetical protein